MSSKITANKRYVNDKNYKEEQLITVSGNTRWKSTWKKQNRKYSSDFWNFLQYGVAMNRFQIFPCENYMFSYAMQLFLLNFANFTLWQCNWLKLRRTLLSGYYCVTMYFLHWAMKKFNEILSRNLRRPLVKGANNLRIDVRFIYTYNPKYDTSIGRYKYQCQPLKHYLSRVTIILLWLIVITSG